MDAVMHEHEVAWTLPDGERQRETFTRTGEFCVGCGREGTWASGDRSRRVCRSCGTLVRLADQPVVADGFWAEIVAQLP